MPVRKRKSGFSDCHNAKSYLASLGSLLMIFLSVPPIEALGNSSCPTPVCPGGRQVVAICCVEDSIGSSSTFWNGSGIVDCGTGDFLILSHTIPSATSLCAGTTFIASIVSVEGAVYTSELSMVPTSSNNGETVGCNSPTLGSPIHHCTLDVLSVDVTGQLEQQGLSGAFVNVNLIESSGFACVDEYFGVISGIRMNSTNTRIGPFSSMDLCSSPEIPIVTVGTSRNGLDGSTATVMDFRANTIDLYSNLAASHLFDESGVTLNLNWTVVDQTIMAQSNVTCSCLSSSVLSTSATSHSLQLSYENFTNELSSSSQVTLSVSYQNGLCRDTDSIVYDVINFGAATIPSSGSETVSFSFNEALLASDVNVSRIIGSCEDSTQEMFWDYPIRFLYNFTSTCGNGSYVFQALSSDGMAIGFPFSVQVDSPTNPSGGRGVDAVAIGAAVGGSLAGLLAIIILIVLGALLYCKYMKTDNPARKDVEKDKLTHTNSGQPPADSLYADPNTIEHEAAPGTEDQYAMVDRKVKKNTKPKSTPPEALYQDPNTIEHETAASGDTYAVVDKPKRSSKKKGGPDVVPPTSEGLTYADIDLSSKRPKPGSGRQAPQQPGEYPKEHPVEYSSVDHGNTSQL